MGVRQQLESLLAVASSIQLQRALIGFLSVQLGCRLHTVPDHDDLLSDVAMGGHTSDGVTAPEGHTEWTVVWVIGC